MTPDEMRAEIRRLEAEVKAAHRYAEEQVAWGLS